MRNPEDLRAWGGEAAAGSPPEPLSPASSSEQVTEALGLFWPFELYRVLSLFFFFFSLFPAYEVPAGSESAVPSRDALRGPARGSVLAPGCLRSGTGRVPSCPGPAQLASSGRGRRGSLPAPAGSGGCCRGHGRTPAVSPVAPGWGLGLCGGTGRREEFS